MGAVLPVPDLPMTMVLAMSFETGHHAPNKKPRRKAWFGGRNFKASQPMLRPLFWFKFCVSSATATVCAGATAARVLVTASSRLVLMICGLGALA